MTAAIDLAAVRAARDAEVRLGRAVTANVFGYLSGVVTRWAERADQAHNRLVSGDPEAAAGAVAWCARRLRAKVKRVLDSSASDALKADVTGTCLDAFEARLRVLAAERAQTEGGAK